MTYIDGFVAAAKTANRDRYTAYAKEAPPWSSSSTAHCKC